MRRSIHRLRAGCHDRLGIAPTVPPPASTSAIDGAEAELGRPIPAQLRVLYRVADGMHAYSFYLPPTRDLARSDQAAKQYLHHLQPGGAYEAMTWGEPPSSPALATFTEDGGYLLLEESGPHEGHLTALDAKVGQGYHWLAPSLVALLEAWALVAETGPIFMSTSAAGIRSPNADDDTPAIEEALRGHPCGPAAVAIFPDRPKDLQ